MKVDTIFSLKKLTDLSDEVLSVYLHEYVHYLQDISTTFGLMNASWVVEYMKYSAEKIRKNYEEKFPVPLPIVKEDYHKVYENNLIMNVYAGTNIRLTELVITEIEREIFNVSIDGVNKPLPKVKIHFKDSYGSSTSFFFGATCVIESMAFLIETNCCGELFGASTIPYKSAQAVAEFGYPEFSASALNIIALCDASLFAFHPGDFFVSCLRDMQKKNWLPKEPEEVYDYANTFSKTFLNVAYDGANDLEQLYEQFSKNAVKELQGYFTIDLFNDTKKWIEIIVDSAFKIRKENPYIFLELATSGNPRNNKVFTKLIRELGTPLVLNSNGEGTFYHPKENEYNFYPYALAAVSEVFSMLTTRRSSCSLYGFCKESSLLQNIPDYTDERCRISPWKKVTDDPLCPYGQIWKMWDLAERTPDL